ncbi:hypothetical protein HDU88_007276, partial [Geranomyces variabilis]
MDPLLDSLPHLLLLLGALVAAALAWAVHRRASLHRPLAGIAFRDLFGNGIINSDGAMWKIQRKAGASFFSPRNIKRWVEEVFPLHMTRLHAVLARAAAANVVVNVQELVLEFTLRVFLDIAYGITVGPDEELPADVRAFGDAFDAATAGIEYRFFAPWWKVEEMVTTRGSEMAKNVRIVKDFGNNIVAMRRKAMAQEAGGAAGADDYDHQDLLSLFIECARRTEESDEPTIDTVGMPRQTVSPCDLSLNVTLSQNETILDSRMNYLWLFDTPAVNGSRILNFRSPGMTDWLIEPEGQTSLVLGTEFMRFAAAAAPGTVIELFVGNADPGINALPLNLDYPFSSLDGNGIQFGNWTVGPFGRTLMLTTPISPSDHFDMTFLFTGLHLPALPAGLTAKGVQIQLLEYNTSIPQFNASGFVPDLQTNYLMDVTPLGLDIGLFYCVMVTFEANPVDRWISPWFRMSAHLGLQARVAGFDSNGNPSELPLSAAPSLTDGRDPNLFPWPILSAVWSFTGTPVSNLFGDPIDPSNVTISIALENPIAEARSTGVGMDQRALKPDSPFVIQGPTDDIADRAGLFSVYQDAQGQSLRQTRIGPGAMTATFSNMPSVEIGCTMPSNLPSSGPYRILATWKTGSVISGLSSDRFLVNLDSAPANAMSVTLLPLPEKIAADIKMTIVVANPTGQIISATTQS